MRFYRQLFLSVLASVVLLSACQSNRSTVGGYLNLDTDLRIDFLVDADINPDEGGRPSPLFVRLYELKSDKMIKNAHFLDIFERDEDVLGADLVVHHKLKRFTPGENRTDNLVLDPETKFVGLYAEFYNYQDARYKLVIPVVANNVFRNSVVIRVSGNDLIFNSN